MERTDVSEENITSIIKVTRIGKQGTLAVTRNRITLRIITTTCHPDGGGDTFLRNVGSYKNHTA
jgi:hypothetical protein